VKKISFSDTVIDYYRHTNSSPVQIRVAVYHASPLLRAVTAIPLTVCPSLRHVVV